MDYLTGGVLYGDPGVKLRTGLVQMEYSCRTLYSVFIFPVAHSEQGPSYLPNLL